MASFRLAAFYAAFLSQSAWANVIPRAQSIATGLPNNWTYVGCYTEGTEQRVLNLDGYNNGTSMTNEDCVMYCMDKGYPLAGTEYGRECWCGDTTGESSSLVSDGDCNMACPGNSTENCGAGNRLSVYTGPAVSPAPPNPIDGWAYQGCYSEGTNGRTLTYGVAVTGGSSAMTNELCTSTCKTAGYSLAGTEYGGECWCGDVFANGGVQVQRGCNMACNGDGSETCGGPNRLTLWALIGSGANPTSTISTMAVPAATNGTVSGDSPAVNTVSASGGNTIDTVAHTVATGTAESTVVPVTSTQTVTGTTMPAPSSTVSAKVLPQPWSYKGCYAEPSTGRAFINQQPDNAKLTVEGCVATCNSLGYGVAGMEYSSQCFCDNFVRNGAALVTDSDCSMACSGDSTEKCGAGNRLSVYSNATLIIYQPPTAQKTGLPTNWQYVGCIVDDVANRTLPWMSIDMANTTASACIASCSKFGYEAGGIEYGYQCFCGDKSDVANKNRLTLMPETDCNVACSGDPTHICGGGNRLSYYEWKGQSLTRWSYASGTAAGSYDFIMSSPIIPLISTVGINQKVVFVEKHGTSLENNSTGSFEFDPSLAPNYSTAFRELQLKTDVFCSASMVLPDKAGRQINIGGWSLDSLHGIRLLTTNSSLGTQGTTNWEEDVSRLALLDPRWYPSASIMSNGSIMVIGGENGSDGPMVASAEVLPRPAGVTKSTYLEYLDKVEKVNSYPFITVLPSGNMFFSQYNEARVISQVDFSTVRMLPQMPGAVNNPESGRNYPLQGTMVLLPLTAPYSNPLQILICGGTTDGANFGLDNCISTHPDVPGEDWVIERMPSTRVVSCMVALPDGRYLIMNGAFNGRAGFGLAPTPNKGAVLYDPTKPVGQRMTQLANSTIGRLYHSEAVLMNDGRVLVTGSDPEDGKNPQEHRMEYFSPDYILSGAPRPTFNVSNKDWAYGQNIPFTLTSTTQGTIKVSLLAAVGSTHGNNMGQRTVFPAVSCSGQACTVQAPPNSKISPPAWYQMFVLDGPTPSRATWIRIGGDPAQIGNWPQLPGFTPPGVGSV